MVPQDARHPRCGGEWRGPFRTDDGPVEVCNTCGALSRYKLPEADAMIGNVRGWLPETIDAWHAARPGRGARTDLRGRAA
jgi:hypothetical protein